MNSANQQRQAGQLHASHHWRALPGFSAGRYWLYHDVLRCQKYRDTFVDRNTYGETFWYAIFVISLRSNRHFTILELAQHYRESNVSAIANNSLSLINLNYQLLSLLKYLTHFARAETHMIGPYWWWGEAARLPMLWLRRAKTLS